MPWRIGALGRGSPLGRYTNVTFTLVVASKARTLRRLRALSKLHIRLAPLTGFVPLKGRLQCRARIARGLKQVERHPNDSPLHVLVVGLAAWITEGKVGKDKTRYAALLNNIARRAQDDCGNALRLKMSGDQTHGLVTHRSQGDQQGNIDPILTTEVEHGRGILVHSLPHTIDRGHAIEARRQAAQPALGHVFI